MLTRFLLNLTLCFCITLTWARAQPSRLKILPGLAFYRTDDGHDDAENTLVDKDKDLLKNMWNMVDKMETNKQNKNNGMHTRTVSSEEMPQQKITRHTSSINNNLNYPSAPTISAGTVPAVGTPITTINVYSSFPPTREDSLPTTSLRHQVSYPESFTSSEVGGRQEYYQNLTTNPTFEVAKIRQNPYGSYLSPAVFDQTPVPLGSIVLSDSLIGPPQYKHLMNTPNTLNSPTPYDSSKESTGNIGQSYFESNYKHNPEMRQGFRPAYGMETPTGSAPLQLLVPQINKNPGTRALEEMTQEHYGNLQPETLRARMFY